MSNENEDWEEFKRNRNQVVRIVKQAKRDYYAEIIDKSMHDAKKMWKAIKKLIKNEHNEETSEILFQNKAIKNDLNIAEEFNNYFLNSIEEVVNSIPQVDFELCDFRASTTISDFRLLSLGELYDVIYGMKRKSSPEGLDRDLMILLWNEISNPLLNMVNSSMEEGIFPDILKVATIVPIRKVSNTIKCEEYRPVNMLSSVSKIMEQVVSTQIKQYIETNKLLTVYQSGFRKSHSCETAIQGLVQEWKETMDEGLMIIVVFLDLKRAFETIDKEVLLQKLKEYYGVKGNVIKWIRSYLTERGQKVKYGTATSNERKVKYGIPQGSVLGPLLFILFINDISRIFNCAKFHLFADDTIIYLSGKNCRSTIEILNQELEKLMNWLNGNKLKINVAKTKAMMLGKKKFREELKTLKDGISIGGSEIEMVEEMKYLGLIVDCQLNFKSHVNYMCKKISSKLGVLGRCSGFISKRTRLTIFNTIVLPHFTFVGTVLYIASKSDIDRLQILQNRAMRIILKRDRYCRISVMLRELQWLDVAALAEYQVLVFIHKTVLGLMPEYLCRNVLTFANVHDHGTRGRENLRLQGVSTACAHNSVFVKGAVSYNRLPRTLKNYDVRRFKNDLRVYLGSINS